MVRKVRPCSKACGSLPEDPENYPSRRKTIPYKTRVYTAEWIHVSEDIARGFDDYVSRSIRFFNDGCALSLRIWINSIVIDAPAGPSQALCASLQADIQTTWAASVVCKDLLRQSPSHSQIAVGDSHRTMGSLIEETVGTKSSFAGDERRFVGIRVRGR